MNSVLTPTLLNFQQISRPDNNLVNENEQLKMEPHCLALVKDAHTKTLRISDYNNTKICFPSKQNDSMCTITGLEDLVLVLQKAMKQGFHVNLQTAGLREFVKDNVRFSKLHLQSSLPQIQSVEEEEEEQEEKRFVRDCAEKEEDEQFRSIHYSADNKSIKEEGEQFRVISNSAENNCIKEWGEQFSFISDCADNSSIKQKEEQFRSIPARADNINIKEEEEFVVHEMEKDMETVHNIIDDDKDPANTIDHDQGCIEEMNCAVVLPSPKIDSKGVYPRQCKDCVVSPPESLVESLPELAVNSSPKLAEKRMEDLFLERFFPNLEEMDYKNVEEITIKPVDSLICSSEKGFCSQAVNFGGATKNINCIAEVRNRDYLDHLPRKIEVEEQVFLERFSTIFEHSRSKPLQRIKVSSQCINLPDVESPAAPIQSASPNFVWKEPPKYSAAAFSARSDSIAETLSNRGSSLCSQTAHSFDVSMQQSFGAENVCLYQGNQYNVIVPENDPCHDVVSPRRQPQVYVNPCGFHATNETGFLPTSVREIRSNGLSPDANHLTLHHNSLAQSCPSLSQATFQQGVCLTHQFPCGRIMNCSSERNALFPSQAKGANHLLNSSNNSPLSCKSSSHIVQQGDNSHRCVSPFHFTPPSCKEFHPCTEHYPYKRFQSQILHKGTGLDFGNSKMKEKKLVWLSAEEAEIIRLIRLSYVKETSNSSSLLESPAMSARVPENCEDGAIYDRKTISHISSRLSSCSADELMSPVVEEGIPMLRDPDVRWRKHARIIQSTRPNGWETKDERQRIPASTGYNGRYFDGSTHSSSGNDWEAEDEKPGIMRDADITEREPLGEIHLLSATEQNGEKQRQMACSTQMGSAASCIQNFWRKYIKRKMKELEEQRLTALKFISGMATWQEPRLQAVIKAMNPEKLVAWYSSLQSSASLIQQAWRKASRRNKEDTFLPKKLPTDIKDLYELIKRRHVHKGLVPPTYERFSKLYERFHAVIEGARIRRRLKSRRLQIIIKEIKEIRLVLHEMSQEKYTESSPNFVPQLCTQLQQKIVQLHTALSGPQDAARVLLRRCPSTPLLVCTPNGDPSSAQDSPVQVLTENVILKAQSPVGQLPPLVTSGSTGIEVIIPKETESLKPNEPSPKVERKKLTISLTRHLRRARQSAESQKITDNNPNIENITAENKTHLGRNMPSTEDLSSKENNIPVISRRIQGNALPQTNSSASLQEKHFDVNVDEFEEPDTLDSLNMPKRPFLRRKSVAMAPQKLDWSKVKPMVSSRLEPELNDKLFKTKARGTAAMKTNYTQVKSRLFSSKTSSSRDSTDIDEAPTNNRIVSKTKVPKSRKQQTKTPDSDDCLPCQYEQGFDSETAKNAAKDSVITHVPKISNSFNDSSSQQSHIQPGKIGFLQETPSESLPEKNKEETAECRRNQARSRDALQYGTTNWQRTEDKAVPDFLQQKMETNHTISTGDVNVASTELEKMFEQVILKKSGWNISLNSLFPPGQEQSIVPRLHPDSNIFEASLQEKRKLHETLRRGGRASRLQRDCLTFVSMRD